MPLKTLSIGGATYDLFLRMKAEGEKKAVRDGEIILSIGNKLQIGSVTEGCGGGASNTAVGLQRLGCSASFCGVVSADQWGQKMLGNLIAEHIDTSPATIVDGETSSFSIILSVPSGERTILYTPGVSEHLKDATFDRDLVLTADAVFLNHLCESSCEIEDDLIEMLRRKPGIHLSWNPGGCQIRAGMHDPDKAALLRETSLLLLNKEEALAFTHATSLVEALKLLSKAGARAVCITDGANGTHAADREHTYFCPARKDIAVVDATGAGDAFGSGATWGLLTRNSLPTALMSGTLNASSVLTKVGAQAGLLTQREMQDLLSQNLLTIQTLD